MDNDAFATLSYGIYLIGDDGGIDGYGNREEARRAALHCSADGIGCRIVSVEERYDACGPEASAVLDSPAEWAAWPADPEGYARLGRSGQAEGVGWTGWTGGMEPRAPRGTSESPESPESPDSRDFRELWEGSGALRVWGETGIWDERTAAWDDDDERDGWREPGDDLPGGGPGRLGGGEALYAPATPPPFPSYPSLPDRAV